MTATAAAVLVVWAGAAAVALRGPSRVVASSAFVVAATATAVDLAHWDAIAVGAVVLTLVGHGSGGLERSAARRATAAGWAAAVALALTGAGPLWAFAIHGTPPVAAVLIATLDRREAGMAARRVQLLVLGVCASAATALLVLATLAMFGAAQVLGVAVVAAAGLVPASVVATALPAAMARADRIAVYAVRWSIGAPAMAAVCFVLVVGLGGRPSGGERAVLASGFAAAAVIAGLVVILHARLDAFANRVAYGQRQSPAGVLDDFSRRLTRPLTSDEQLLQLAESLRAVLATSRVEIWVADNGELERLVSLPRSVSATIQIDEAARGVAARAGVVGRSWMQVWLPSMLPDEASALVRLVPAAAAGELLGIVVIHRSAGAERFTVSEEAMLADLGPRLGLALQAMKLEVALRQSLREVRRHAEELERSRARIVRAGDTERRRIERDLHDGAQQRLIALALKAAIAGKAIRSDPDRAVALVEELKAEVTAATAEIRTLSHGIYPPTLEGEGLAAALSEVAARFPFRVSVDVQASSRYPPSVEAAVYFCCLEALQNAAKHAGDDPRVRMCVRSTPNELLFEITDDGVGFDATAQHGHGLVGMQDRAGAFGGVVDVESACGAGTTVRGRVPLWKAGSDEGE